MAVEAHCFTDGHDLLRVVLRWRKEDEAAPVEMEMVHDVNDVWRGPSPPPARGRYRYGVLAGVDHFRSWRQELSRRIEPDDIRIAAQIGADLIEECAGRAHGSNRKALAAWAARLRRNAIGMQPADDAVALKNLALDDALAMLADQYPDRRLESSFPVELPLVADRERARFSTWYELFPRSASTH